MTAKQLIESVVSGVDPVDAVEGAAMEAAEVVPCEACFNCPEDARRFYGAASKEWDDTDKPSKNNKVAMSVYRSDVPRLKTMVKKHNGNLVTKR